MAAMSEMIVDKTPDGGFRNDHMARLNDASSTILDLEGQELGDDSIIEIANDLKKNSTLKTLKLTDNGITDVGAIAIADALKENRSLTHLSLQDNDVTNDGAIAIAEALDSNTTLQTLNLGYNDIGVEGLGALLGKCRHDVGSSVQNNGLINLDVQFNDIGPDCADHIVEALRAPATSSEGSPEATSGGGGDNGLKQYGLISLTLLHTELGAEAVVKIANALTMNGGNRRLKHLDLGSNDIGNEGTIALASALSCSKEEEGGNKGIPCALSHLFLFDNDVGKTGCEALVECLKVNKILTFIDLEENDEIEDEPDLLQTINDSLSSNRSLKLATFAEWCDAPLTTPTSAEEMDENSSLLTVKGLTYDFEGDHIKDEGVKEIATILSDKFNKDVTGSHLSSLTGLNLNENGITEEGIVFLADMIEKASLNNDKCCIQCISLKYNPIFKQGSSSSTAMTRIETVLEANMNKSK